MAPDEPVPSTPARFPNPTGIEQTASRQTTSEQTVPTRRHRWGRIVVIVSLIVVLMAAFVGVAVRGNLADPTDPSVAGPLPPVATVAVTTGAMVNETDVRGALAYVGGIPVTAGSSGVLTSLPAVGTRINPGGTLYTVNTRPVVLLAGALPAWRTLRVGTSDGEDVRQLERNLSAFGRFRQAPDTHFTAATATAVRSWQRSLGVDPTGVVERSAILFAPQPLRVATISSRLGVDVTPGAELYKTSGLTKVVAVDVGLGDQKLAVVGAAVKVVLLDGTKLRATVTAVGETVERPGGEGGAGKVVVPVTVALTDQAGAASSSQADITVRFISTLGKDLLTVPVEALVAIDSSSFGVQVPDPARTGRTTVMPVTVGAFASGRVVISGGGIVPGLRVVVAGP